ncbi:Rid family detoxifying hydrolase [Massilia niabensis]|uniref:Rid family detoxifying hydrolase n=1 Tax=Massilia niabensis TaxID=544910 RepID=A0ABW0LC52_9BURK
MVSHPFNEEDRVNTRKLMTALCVAATAIAASGCAVHSHRGKEVLSTDQIYPAIGPYSQMVGHGKVIYFSGVIPLDKTGTTIVGATTEEQTRQVLDYIRAKLASQGLNFSDVLMSTVYMKDLNDFAAMNRVYGEYFQKDPPARATLEVARLPRDARIEIAVVAARR